MDEMPNDLRHDSARIRLHQARHRDMGRDPRPDLDCLAEQEDAARNVDELAAALIRKASARLADRLMRDAGL